MTRGVADGPRLSLAGGVRFFLLWVAGDMDIGCGAALSSELEGFSFLSYSIATAHSAEPAI